jgi:3-oxoacyl-[acyl-carrier protein] reductase
MSEQNRVLADRVAVVTGTATGIGQATARRFAAAGASLVLVDHQDELNRRLAAELTEQGAEAAAFAVDLRDREATDSCIAEIAGRYARIDVLVNNAGALLVTPLDQLTLQAWDETHDLHLRAPAAFILGLLPALRASNEASVINNASIDGVFGHPLMAAYGTAKGGLVALTRNFAYGLGADNIRINCLATGGIQTPLLDGVDDDARAILETNAPLRRLGTPEEVAEAMLFLASAASSFITGAVLTVDGGRTAVTAGVAQMNPAARR